MSVEAYLTGAVDLLNNFHSYKSEIVPKGFQWPAGTPLLAPITQAVEMSVDGQRVRVANGPHGIDLGNATHGPADSVQFVALWRLRMLAGWIYINGRRIHIGTGDVGAAVDDALTSGGGAQQAPSRPQADTSGVQLIMRRADENHVFVYAVPDGSGLKPVVSVWIEDGAKRSATVEASICIEAQRADSKQPWQLGEFAACPEDVGFLAVVLPKIAAIRYFE